MESSKSVLVMFDTRGFAFKNKLGPGQVERNPHPRSDPHKGIVKAIDEHVPGALHVLLLVTYECVSREVTGDSLLAKPTLETGFGKWAVAAWLFHVWKL